MDIINFLDGFTSESLTAKVSSRRAVLGTLGVLGTQFAVAAGTPNCLKTSSGAYKATTNVAINALQLALLLEYLEAEFYVRALESGVLPGGRPEAVYMQISKHETAHVAFLTAALIAAGADPIMKPKFDYTVGGAFAPFDRTNENAYLQLLTLAQAFEDTGVRAYKGQAGNLQNTAYLTPALRIHSVEARHASEARRLRADYLGMNLDVDSLGWITLDHRSPQMPAATQPVYNGEDNVVQGGINLVDATAFGAIPVSQAFDEPIDANTAFSIAFMFLSCGG